MTTSTKQRIFTMRTTDEGRGIIHIHLELWVDKQQALRALARAGSTILLLVLMVVNVPNAVELARSWLT